MNGLVFYAIAAYVHYLADIGLVTLTKNTTRDVKISLCGAKLPCKTPPKLHFEKQQKTTPLFFVTTNRNTS